MDYKFSDPPIAESESIYTEEWIYFISQGSNENWELRVWEEREKQ